MTFIFLLVADIASGVTAMTQIIDVEEGTIFDETVVLTVSIISSVSQLWNADSQVLAIFICLTSVMWPYLKLFFSLAAWLMPIRSMATRERFIEVLDAMDKWSFVYVIKMMKCFYGGV